MKTAVTTAREVGSRLLAMFAAAWLVIFAGWTIAVQPAGAIPPGGPSPNTPGTWSTVTPTTVEPSGLIRFTVGGFPAGETLYIKIDDGLACGASASHGACVYHTQAIPSSGVVNGSFYLPGDLAAGNHWLRFLASAPAPGGGQGTIGFTLRSPDFTISSGSAGGSSGGSGGGSSSGGSGSGGGSSSGGSSGGTSGGTAGGGSGSTGGGTAGGGDAANQAGQAAGVAGETVRVEAGEVSAEPDFTPTIPAASGEALEDLEAGDVTAQVIDDRVVLAVGEDFAGEWVFTYAYSDPTELGWQQVAVDGTVTISAGSVEAGDHHFAVLDVDDELVGWTTAEVTDEAAQVAPTSAESETEAASSVPWVAVAVLAVAVLALAAVFGVLLRRKPKTTQQSTESPEPAHTTSSHQS